MTVLGSALLLLALAAALYGGVAFLFGRPGKSAPARYAVYALAAGTTLAIVLLLIALLSHDFSLKYVYENSSRTTPNIYLISALWAGNGGALLLWSWLVSLGGTALLVRGKKATEGILSYALPVVLAAAAVFLILTLTANPFSQFTPPDTNGVGLNPLLMNPGMVVHPPLLLAGWALTVIPFALAIAALAAKKLGNDWLEPARRWAILAWVLLGAGNLIGMWWAYTELNWGGYWGWDAVENAGLMPWLLLTAFLHSAAIQRRRGLFKSWSLLLIIFAFVLTLVGAFIERAGINSVHSFGDTPQAPILLAAIVLTLLVGLGLLVSRRRDMKEEPGDEEIISGETTFLLNNLLFSAVTLVVLVLTFLPTLSGMVTGNELVVGPGYFNPAALTLFLVILLLAGVCVFVGWKRPDPGQLGRSLLWPAVIAAALVAILAAVGVRHWDALAGLLVLAFAFLATVLRWVTDLRARRHGTRESYPVALRRMLRANGPRYGGFIVHLGILIMAVGIVCSTAYHTRAESVTLKQGQSYTIQGYTLTYEKLVPQGSAGQMTVTANVMLTQGGRTVAELYPEQSYSASRDSWVVETAKRSNLGRDLWVALEGWDAAAPDGTQTAYFTVLVSPLLAWVWIGGIIGLLGGLTAFYAPPRKETAGG
jgi:cytochrome c-type biogenesis protein CcmF